MADGNFDPCECVWSHDAAMQRLLNLVHTSFYLNIFLCQKINNFCILAKEFTVLLFRQ